MQTQPPLFFGTDTREGLALSFAIAHGRAMRTLFRASDAERAKSVAFARLVAAAKATAMPDPATDPTTDPTAYVRVSVRLELAARDYAKAEAKYRRARRADNAAQADYAQAWESFTSGRRQYAEPEPVVLAKRALTVSVSK